MSMCYICKYRDDSTKMGKQICALCTDDTHFEPRHDCGTCLNNNGGWECDRCKDHDLWTIRNVYEGQPDEPKEPQLEQTGAVIQLNVSDESCMSVANAICNYCITRMGDIETALIFMDELTEHIDSYVRAERKWLEYQKRKEE